MSAEVICLSSSDEDASSSSSRHSRVVKVKSVTKSSAAVAASGCDGGGKNAQKRHLTADATVAAPPSASSDHPRSPAANSNVKKLKVDPAGCSSKAVGALLPVAAAAAAAAGVKKESQVVKPQLVVVTKIPIPPANEDVFQKFVATCLKRRDDKDTKQVLLKLEKLHSKLSTIQKQDNEFRLLISNCHSMISKGLTKDIYTPILELHTEIKRLLKIKPAAAAAAAALEQDAADKGLQQQQQAKKQFSKGDEKKIKLLESSIKKCLQKIKILEEKEVDFDDDADSAYIQEDKYKRRLIQLCNALSKQSDDKILRKQLLKKKIKRNDISDEMTGIPSVDEAILNFVNSDISKINQFKHLEAAAGQRCADHVKMPEYLDILACIAKCNNDSNLELSKEKMEKLAKRAFTTVGNFLKKKRMDETKLYIQSFQLGVEEEDPAIKDVNLNRKLRENKKEGDKKLEEIFKKYVDKQEGLSQEDMEKQQHVSSDIENGNSSSSSSSSGESDTENFDAENKQVDDGTKKQVVVGSKSGIISSSRSDDVNEGRHPDKAPIADGDDDDDDLLALNDRCDDLDDGSTDPLDIHQVSSPAAVATTQQAIVQNELLQKLQRSNEILLVKNDKKTPPQPVDGGQSTVGGGQQVERQAPAVKAASAPPQGSPPPPPHHKPETTSADDTGSKENEVNRSKTPVIKVCAFAKPPPAWGSAGSSPEKVKKISDSPSPKVGLQSPPPPAECIDLTKEEGKTSERLPARSINPLAKRTSPSAAAAAPQPVKRVVIVKNVINNYHVPLSEASAAAAAAANSRRKNTFHSSRSNSSSSSSSSSKDNNRRDAVWLSKEKAMKRPRDI